MDKRLKQIKGPVDKHGAIGSLHLPYSQVVKVLGEPNCKDDPDKVDVSWAVQEKSGKKRKLGVWNYKNGPAYLKKGTLNDIDEFSIGGTNDQCVDLAKELFGHAVE